MIWSRDTGQQIPCFDSCQLSIIWMSNIKDNGAIHSIFGKQSIICCQATQLSPKETKGGLGYFKFE